MVVQFCRPQPPLFPYVELLTWYADFEPDYARERILPQGVVELIIDLTEPPKYIYDNDSLAVTQTCRKAWIAGLRHEYITISALPGSSMLVVRFREGMAYPVLQLPLGLLRNQVLPADLTLDPEISRLREQLVNALTPEEKFAFTRAFLTNLPRISSLLAYEKHIAHTFTCGPDQLHDSPKYPGKLQNCLQCGRKRQNG